MIIKLMQKYKSIKKNINMTFIQNGYISQISGIDIYYKIYRIFSDPAIMPHVNEIH